MNHHKRIYPLLSVLLLLWTVASFSACAVLPDEEPSVSSSTLSALEYSTNAQDETVEKTPDSNSEADVLSDLESTEDELSASISSSEQEGDTDNTPKQSGLWKEGLKQRAAALAECIARCPSFTPDSSMDDFRGANHISVLFIMGSYNVMCDTMGDEGPRLFEDKILITESVTPEIFVSLENANEIAFELYDIENWSDLVPDITDYFVTHNEQVGFGRPLEIGTLANDTELVEIYCGENQITVVLNVSPAVAGEAPLLPDYELELSFRVLPDESLQLIDIS